MHPSGVEPHNLWIRRPVLYRVKWFASLFSEISGWFTHWLQCFTNSALFADDYKIAAANPDETGPLDRLLCIQ